MNIKKHLLQVTATCLIIWLLAGCAAPPPAPSSTPTAAPIPTIEVTTTPETATITGSVHLVAPPTPAMFVYAVDPTTGRWASTETEAADAEAPFTLSVQPGSYQVFAFSADLAYTGYSLDGWSLAQVSVAAGQTAADIHVGPPSQSECGSTFGVPTSPDGRFGAVPGPSAECIAGLVEPQRIQFAAGSISAQVPDSITAEGMIRRYVLSAGVGQSMTVVLKTAGDPTLSGLILTIWGQDGYALASEEPIIQSWTGALPSTQDYFIQVASVAKAPVEYTLDVTISDEAAGKQNPEILPMTTPLGFEFLYGLGAYFMLPPSFPVSEGLPQVLPFVLMVENFDYDILLDYGADCHGAGACHYGSLSGKKVASNQPESTLNFTFEADRAQKVTLAKNIEGYFIEGQCGASCDDSKMFWVYKGYQFMIGLKGSPQKDLVDLANAAIENSLP